MRKVTSDRPQLAARLPTGTLTFLFTDIEGSTRLWDQHPKAMNEIVSRHDSLLRGCIEANSGYVFKTVGDAFCAVFSSPSEALAAALAGQHAIRQEQWPQEIGDIQVRMALHTGQANERDDDYFGPAVNRVARLISIGHGGQVLLSQATTQLAKADLPEAVFLEYRGTHGLKDLLQPEEVYQLTHPNLRAEFPALKSLNDLPNNLPLQLTSFIGREKEIAEVKTLFEKTRLLTLTGSGGCGKTRLSLQVAADLLDKFSDGVWFVELAPLSDPGLVSNKVAHALGLHESAGKSIQQSLMDFLKNRHLLLLIDNCEHLLNACIQLTDWILHTCPRVKILTSSREALGITGELTYRVPSLSLPDTTQTATVEMMSQCEAGQLFVERSMFHLPTFAITNTSVRALTSICNRLDGIPLAIELAAARVRSMSVEEIGDRLDNSFRLLTVGSKTALPRHQTLRALIDWSYQLLNEQERWLLARLSVFAGGWTLEAAEYVGSTRWSEALLPDNLSTRKSQPVYTEDVVDLLTSLVDKSLAIAETKHETTRYRLLETVRQYAREKLKESGEADAVHETHQQYFLALAEKSEPQLQGLAQGEWLRRLETEHDNLRAALEGRNTRAGLRIAGSIADFWHKRGLLTEGRARMSELLRDSVGSTELAVRAKALFGAGNLANGQGDYAAARALHSEGLEIVRELGDKRGIARSLNGLANIANNQCDFDSALPLYEESLMIFNDIGDKMGVAGTLGNMGNLARSHGDYARAYTLTNQALTINRDLGNRAWEAGNLNTLGDVAYYQGDYAAANVMYDEALTINRAIGKRADEALCLIGLANVAIERNEYTSGRALLSKSIAILHELQDKRGISRCLEAFATLALRDSIGNCGAGNRVAVLWGAAEALREAITCPLPPSDSERYNEEVGQAGTAFGAAFLLSWRSGRAMNLDVAIEYALSAGDEIDL